MESIGCDGVPGVDHEAKIRVEGLTQIREMIKETEQKIEELCKQFPEYDFILTIPGFGPDVSSTVLGAIGDPYRFDNGKQVLKRGGLDLSADRSGKSSDKAIPEISKRGKTDLRSGLYQAALIASLKNRDVMIYYTNKIRGEKERKEFTSGLSKGRLEPNESIFDFRREKPEHQRGGREGPRRGQCGASRRTLEPGEGMLGGCERVAHRIVMEFTLSLSKGLGPEFILGERFVETQKESLKRI